MLPDFNIRPVNPQDLPVLQGLIGFEFFVHRHLDWNSPLEWIDKSPFLVLELDGRIIAALACPEDPPGVCWVHLFVTITEYQPKQTWPLLFPSILDYLQDQPQVLWLSAISLQTWFTSLLQESGFQHFQDIVVLEQELDQPKPHHYEMPAQAQIRLMENEDLRAVAEVDRLAFHPLWQNTFEVLSKAWGQGSYSTVAELAGEIIGYQICTASIYNAHLARLAVHPKAQRLGFGAGLIHNLGVHFLSRGVTRLTVNTQSDNIASLALYRKVGFELSGDSYPVFVYPQANL